MKYQLSMAAVAVMTLVPLWARQLQAGEVELKGVHMCCGVCAKRCVEGVLKKVDGVTGIQSDHQKKTVTFTAKDEEVANLAIKTLYGSGSCGQATVDGKKFKVDAPSPSKGKKVDQVTVDNVHICCIVCVKTINDLFKDLKVEYSGEGRQKQLKVSGEKLDAAEVLEKLRRAGFNGTYRRLQQ